jgi:hypothetical protein
MGYLLCRTIFRYCDFLLVILKLYDFPMYDHGSQWGLKSRTTVLAKASSNLLYWTGKTDSPFVEEQALFRKMLTSRREEKFGHGSRKD